MEAGRLANEFQDGTPWGVMRDPLDLPELRLTEGVAAAALGDGRAELPIDGVTLHDLRIGCAELQLRKGVAAAVLGDGRAKLPVDGVAFHDFSSAAPSFN